MARAADLFIDVRKIEWKVEWWGGEGKDLHCTLVLARLSGQGNRLIYSC